MKEYEKIAPAIVTVINFRKDSIKIWKKVYEDIIVANSLLMSGLPNEAIVYYIEMTKRLEKEYLN